MEKIKMSRLIIYPSTVCNLRCKICCEYIPHISGKGLQYHTEWIKKALYEYFEIVSNVKMITISGGEPFLSDSTAEIAEFLTQFSSQYEKLEVMTNATVCPSRKLLEALQENSKALVFINDYGDLSRRVNEVSDVCDKWNIRYTVRNYHGKESHCGGWYDVAMLSGERLTDEGMLKERFAHCQTGNNPRLGLSFGLFGGKIFSCSMAGMAERLGMMSDTSAYLDLCDDTLSYVQKRNRLKEMQQREYMPACAVCRGNDSRIEVERFTPAEQWN